jgi:hypothetical protein
MPKVETAIKKKKPFTLRVPIVFPTMTRPDILTVLEWYVKDGDIIEPPRDINNLPPLLDVDAPYYGGSEITLPVPEFLCVPHRVVRILKPEQSTVQLGDELIMLEPLEDNVA